MSETFDGMRFEGPFGADGSGVPPGPGVYVVCTGASGGLKILGVYESEGMRASVASNPKRGCWAAGMQDGLAVYCRASADPEERRRVCAGMVERRWYRVECNDPPEDDFRGDGMGRHVMEALGRARVVIEDGKVVEVGEPLVRSCPLFRDHRGIEEFTEEAIRENMELRIRDFGMCTGARKARMGYFLSFGVSEVLSLAVSRGIVDAAVIAADGCGTAVLDDPELIQGMGGRISGMVETCPIPAVMEAVGPERALDPATAEIDQMRGLEKAFAMGFGRVGVTTASAAQSAEMRRRFGPRAVICAVHTTGATAEEAEAFFSSADIVTACASKAVRDAAARRAVLQAGTKVPIYAATEAGAELMRAKLEELGREPDTELTDSPSPLV